MRDIEGVTMTAKVTFMAGIFVLTYTITVNSNHPQTYKQAMSSSNSSMTADKVVGQKEKGH